MTTSSPPPDHVAEGRDVLGQNQSTNNRPNQAVPAPEAVRKRKCECTLEWALFNCHHLSCRQRRGENV